VEGKRKRERAKGRFRDTLRTWADEEPHRYVAHPSSSQSKPYSTIVSNWHPGSSLNFLQWGVLGRQNCATSIVSAVDCRPRGSNGPVAVQRIQSCGSRLVLPLLGLRAPSRLLVYTFPKNSTGIPVLVDLTLETVRSLHSRSPLETDQMIGSTWPRRAGTHKLW